MSMPPNLNPAHGAPHPARNGHAGRPRNKYSISAALERFSNQIESVEDDGTPITAATVAAKWLWACVVAGKDRESPLEFNDRLAAFKTIRSAIEPKDKPIEEVEDGLASLKTLSDDELSQLETLLEKAAHEEAHS